MEGTSPTRGSPSEQLVAFNPMGLEAFAHRVNPGPFPGMSTIRPAGDPFAGWPNGLRPGPNVSVPQVPSAGSTSGHAYQSYFPTQASQSPNNSALIATSSARASLEHSSVSTQLSPARPALGGMQYSPSQPQASGTLDQWQYSPYSPSHGQAYPKASRYPISPIQTTSNARYSPSYEAFGYKYSPTSAFASRLSATTDGAPQLDAYPATAQVPSDTPSATHNAAFESSHNAALQSLSHGTLDFSGNHRSFIVHGVPRDTSHCSINLLLPIHEYPSLEDVCVKHIEHSGMFSLSFADLREAVAAMNKIRLSRPEWQVTPATAHEIANFTGSNKVLSVPRDGEFDFSVHADPTEWVMVVQHLNGVVDSLITSFGAIHSCTIVEEGTSMRKYHIRYFNTHQAAYAFSCLDGYKVECLQFRVTRDGQEDLSLWPPLRVPNFSCSPQSPVTPYRISSISKENSAGEYDNEVKIDISPTSAEGQTSPEHAISLDRIRQGLDVRSTVMIRNIPNKITSDQLKSILDESSFGKYDFLYLRMDFTHRCNVGYAFMNFGDAIDIVALVHARQGKTWPDCISEKKAEVSYATLQGKEALVNKFRNSHVMTRPHDERPRLFHISGPRTGTEAAFPGPNDASKLRRSVASTTQQGLFAPRNRAATTPRTNRTRSQSQTFGHTPRSRPSTRTLRHSGGRSLQYTPGGFASMQADDHRFIRERGE